VSEGKYSVEVKYLGIYWEVEYDYYPGYPGSREDPPEPPELEIVNVYVNGENALDLYWSLTDDAVQGLYERVCEEANKDEWEGVYEL
jgi:hypothetical protein